MAHEHTLKALLRAAVAGFVPRIVVVTRTQRRMVMRTNASLRIRVANSLISWGPLAVFSVNDNDLSDGSLWRLAAGLHDATVEPVNHASKRERRLLLLGS